MIRESVIKGLEQIRNSKRLIAWYYIWNVIVGMLLTLPLFIFFNNHLGKSLMSESLSHHFNMKVLFELMHYENAMPAMLRTSLLIALPLYALLQLWFSGGAFQYIVSKSPFSFTAFMSDATRLLGRYIRLLLWCLPVFVLIFGLLIVYSIMTKHFMGEEASEVTKFWNAIIQIGIGIICAMACTIVFDYARIDVVHTDNQQTMTSMWRGFLITFRNIVKTGGLAGTVVILGLGILVIFFLLSLLLGGAATWVIVLMFVLHQIYIIARIVLRLTLIASQAHMYHILSNEASLRQSIHNGGSLLEVV